MKEFQTHKTDVAQTRIVDASTRPINSGEIRVKVDRFAFTANNITYAVMGEQLRYWQFFPPHGEQVEQWGIIPVWGFADVVESNHAEIPVGERLFGYFLPSDELIMRPSKVSAEMFIEASDHRLALPIGYNSYRRVSNEPGYDTANDNARMLLYVLHLTSYVIHDFLESEDWFGAEQIIIISASSKTSMGLAHGLHNQANTPSVIGLTSSSNRAFVNASGAYDEVLDYQSIESIDASKATVIVDMSGNAEVLASLHQHLGDKMRFTSNVGATHWDEPHAAPGIIGERSKMFFAPSQIQARISEWGPDEFNKRSMAYVSKTMGQAMQQLSIKELAGVDGLASVYPKIVDGSLPAEQGIVILM